MSLPRGAYSTGAVNWQGRLFRHLRQSDYLFRDLYLNVDQTKIPSQN